MVNRHSTLVRFCWPNIQKSVRQSLLLLLLNSIQTQGTTMKVSSKLVGFPTTSLFSFVTLISIQLSTRIKATFGERYEPNRQLLTLAARCAVGWKMAGLKPWWELVW